MARYEILELTDDRNRNLVAEVSNNLRIELRDSDDHYWSASSEDGVGRIAIGNDDHPISSFTHELLHLWFHTKGNTPPNLFLNPTFPCPPASQLATITEYVEYAHNQLMHRLMFPHFVKMGFSANEFLNSQDAKGDYSFLRGDLRELKARQKADFPYGLPAVLIVKPFLMMRNPHDSSGELQDLRRQLRAIAGPAYYELNKFTTQWSNSENADIATGLAQLFHICEVDVVGFGHTPHDKPDIRRIVWASKIERA
jgi:hypothetical protein